MPRGIKFSLADVLVKNSHYQSNKLRKRLLKECLKHHRCETCKRTHWCGKPIPLELEHIDGDNSNNELTNLSLICPNCHAQTSTYRGKNYGKAIKKHHYRA